MTHASEGVQNKSPQRAPFWHDDYFELKTIKSQKTQEELGTSPLTAWKNSDRGPSSEEQDGLEDGWRSAEPVGSDSFLLPLSLHGTTDICLLTIWSSHRSVSWFPPL